MLVWLAPLFVFGLVIFVHELGHFLAAKAAGVYTPRFSIGFGPAIVRWRRGETEYRIGILPFGGYVRMASRLDEATAGLEGGGETAPDARASDPDAMVPFGPRPVPEHRWFESKQLGARLAIMLAGVTMNLLLGWVINIGLVKAYERDATTRVNQVLPGRPAAAAGLRPGDSIVAVNGRPVERWDSLVALVGRSTGVPVRLGVLRGASRLEIPVTPAPDSTLDRATGGVLRIGRIGAAPELDPTPVGWGRALRDGTGATVDMATLVVSSLGRIASRASVAELGGPVAIVQASSQAARQGWEVLLYLVSLLSVNLAVFNLLPIPILDGGHILVQLVEAARGRPLTDRAREYVLRFGLAVILLLFLTLTFNDIKRLIVGAAGSGPG